MFMYNFGLSIVLATAFLVWWAYRTRSKEEFNIDDFLNKLEDVHQKFIPSDKTN